MKATFKTNFIACVVSLASAVLLMFGGSTVRANQNDANPAVLPPNSHPFGRTYGQWSAAWWKWVMELPLTTSTGATHPFMDDPRFDVTEGQSGEVWFLTAPFGTVTRSITLPAGKALFVPILTAEASNLEGLGNTAAEQRANATATAEAIVVSSLSFSVDGVATENLAAYRAVSPQFSFTAPTPWIFGDVGGSGKAVGDGYYIMLAPLSAGHHTIHFAGTYDFGGANVFSLDMTYNITVQPKSGDRRDDDQD
jgi:hypothetical protein